MWDFLLTLSLTMDIWYRLRCFFPRPGPRGRSPPASAAPRRRAAPPPAAPRCTAAPPAAGSSAASCRRCTAWPPALICRAHSGQGQGGAATGRDTIATRPRQSPALPGPARPCPALPCLELPHPARHGPALLARRPRCLPRRGCPRGCPTRWWPPRRWPHAGAARW